MPRTAWPWLLIVVLVLAPWLMVAAIGGVWLWENQWLLAWLLAMLICNGIAWILSDWLRRRDVMPFRDLPEVVPEPLWSPRARKAWDKVEALAESVDPDAFPLTDTQRLLGLCQRVIGEVAQAFRPAAERPELNISLPEMLGITALVATDLRKTLMEQVPFSHVLSLEDGLNLWRWKEKLQNINVGIRIGRMVINPLNAIPHELVTKGVGKLSRYPVEQLEAWLLNTLVKRVGYYAIKLYSGDLTVPKELIRISEPAPPPQEPEPLRILVAGQTKAGKSSLINALLGQPRAAVDVNPLTDRLVPYELKNPEQANALEALIFDSPGYGENGAWLKKYRKALEQMDLVLLVCSALHAGRDADVKLLDALHEIFSGQPDRAPPPVLVILTHVDQLSPMREWEPPYDVDTPRSPKAQAIRRALQSVAETLKISVTDTLPVNLRQDELYNVEAVWALIHERLSTMERARYLRWFQHQKGGKWRQLFEQLGNAGQLVVSEIRKTGI